MRQVAGWMTRGPASGTMSPIPRDHEPLYNHEPYIDPKPPPTTRYWNSSASQRPPQHSASMLTPLARDSAQLPGEDAQPPRTATRYPGSTQSEGHRSRTPNNEYLNEMVSRVGMLEEKLQRLSETINTERITHARTSLEMMNHLSLVVGWMTLGSRGWSINAGGLS
jgi:hypothetical protein